jgi:2,3-bisphosphoglycerate-independent phosphoglycerate mutase
VKRIRVHTLTDGRDTEDGTSIKFMEQLQKDLAELEKKGCDAKVASGGGRMVVTMDRYEVCAERRSLGALCAAPSHRL